MKTNIIITILSVFMSLGIVSAQGMKSKGQTTHYIINGQIVDAFDGSQLEGEKIKSYSFDPDNNVHIIYTSSYRKGEEAMKLDTYVALARLKEREQFELDSNGMFIVWNGTPWSASEVDIQGLSDIVELTVIKDETNPTFIKYATIAKAYTNQPVRGIMLVNTRHVKMRTVPIPPESSRKSHAWIIQKGHLPKRAKTQPK